MEGGLLDITSKKVVGLNELAVKGGFGLCLNEEMFC